MNEIEQKNIEILNGKNLAAKGAKIADKETEKHIAIKVRFPKEKYPIWKYI